jgi:hypothetical protein
MNNPHARRLLLSLSQKVTARWRRKDSHTADVSSKKSFYTDLPSNTSHWGEGYHYSPVHLPMKPGGGPQFPLHCDHQHSLQSNFFACLSPEPTGDWDCLSCHPAGQSLRRLMKCSRPSLISGSFPICGPFPICSPSPEMLSELWFLNSRHYFLPMCLCKSHSLHLEHPSPCPSPHTLLPANSLSWKVFSDCVLLPSLSTDYPQVSLNFIFWWLKVVCSLVISMQGLWIKEWE